MPPQKIRDDLNQKGELSALRVDEIILDERFRVRSPHVDHVSALADLVREDKQLPRVQVRRIDGKLYLVGGWHTYQAHIDSGRKIILANVLNCTVGEARIAAAAGNNTQAHKGLRLNGEETRRAVWLVLEGLEETQNDWSDRMIGQRVGCSHATVAAVRSQFLARKPEAPPTDRKRVGADGKARSTPRRKSLLDADTAAPAAPAPEPKRDQPQPAAPRPAAVPMPAAAQLLPAVPLPPAAPVTADAWRELDPETFFRYSERLHPLLKAADVTTLGQLADALEHEPTRLCLEPDMEQWVRKELEVFAAAGEPSPPPVPQAEPCRQCGGPQTYHDSGPETGWTCPTCNKPAPTRQFDWARFETLFGSLVRGVDQIAAAYGDNESAEFQEAQSLLERFRVVWKRWKGKVSKGGS